MSVARIALLGALAATLLAGAAPTTASASSAELFVGHPPLTRGARASCSNPTFAAIQDAIDAAAAGERIHVCPGVYREQLTITKPITLQATPTAAPATLRLPSDPQASSTACDEAPDARPSAPDEDALSICTSGSVRIDGLTIEADWPSTTCSENLYGVLVGGGATLIARDVTIRGAGPEANDECPDGVALQVGIGWKTAPEGARALLRGDAISGYHRAGVAVDGSGASAQIGNTTITGVGTSARYAQDGVAVSDGAFAKLLFAHISNNECSSTACGPSALNQAQSAGVALDDAAVGSSIKRSGIDFNDSGVHFISRSPTQPTSPEVSVIDDKLVGNRYEAFVLDQGDLFVKLGTMYGPGNVGIELLQDAQQAYAPTSSAFNCEIQGVSQAAVKIETDGLPDLPAVFSISETLMEKNAAEVIDPSPNFVVKQRGNL